MPDNVAIPAVRQNRSKLAPTSCQASSTIAPAPMAADVVIFFMALLSFVGFDTPSLTGSRRATPTSQFQQQPGHPPPDPPNSAGKSLNFGRPSFMGSTVSA